MAKVLALFLLALLTISMLHTAAFGLVKPPGRPKPGRPGKPPLTPGTVKNLQCPLKCSGLCSKTKYPKPCLQLCMKCCKKCKCIPIGNDKANCPCKC